MAQSEDSTTLAARRERIDLRIDAGRRKRYEAIVAKLNAQRRETWRGSIHAATPKGQRYRSELTLSDFLRIAADEAADRFDAANAPERVRAKPIAKARAKRGPK